jgi:hypothetical protein
MARKKTLQTSFASGEIAPELGMRQDADQYKNGAKALTNMRCLIGGGVTRRPGTWWQQELNGPSIAFDFTVSQSVKYVLCFSNGRMDAFLEDGTAAGSVTGAPWTAVTYAEIDVFGSANTVFVMHPACRCRRSCGPAPRHGRVRRSLFSAASEGARSSPTTRLLRRRSRSRPPR